MSARGEEPRKFRLVKDFDVYKVGHIVQTKCTSGRRIEVWFNYQDTRIFSLRRFNEGDVFYLFEPILDSSDLKKSYLYLKHVEIVLI